MVSVRVDTSDLRRVVREIGLKLTSGRIQKAAAEELHRQLVGFYEGKGSRFWARFSPNSDGGFTVTHDNRNVRASIGGYNGVILAHKRDGGPIHTKDAGALAVPLTPEARRAGSPRDGRTPDLFVLKTKTHAFLAQPGPRGGTSRRRVKLWYILVKSVMQRADPYAMPNQEDLKRGIVRAVAEEIKRMFS